MIKGMVKGKYAPVLKNLIADLRLRNYSKRTIDSYFYHNNKFLEFVDKSPKDVSKEDIKKYLSYLAINKEVKPATFNLILSSIKFYYEEVLKKRFKLDLKRAKLGKSLPVVISRKEIKQMIEVTSNQKHKLLITVLYSAGLRVSECLSLKIDHISLENKSGIIRKGKGNKDRFFKLSEFAVNLIKRYIEKRNDNNPYLFKDHQGHLSVRSAQVIVKKAAKNAGIKQRVFCHALRSSFATHLIEDKVPINIVQKLLGHKNINTTLGYLNTSASFMDNVESPLDKIMKN
ncbi:tyrosine-type recombinase/integrase [Candidatus Woesearchaeota archaeon]|nr:tyrosine-type recombinase/integrase [Candidatus Woesearchaeota archaeon]